MRYVKAFVVAAPVSAVFYHYVTQNNPQPITWWPDSATMGTFIGIIATAVQARLRIFFGPNLLRLLGRAFRREA